MSTGLGITIAVLGVALTILGTLIIKVLGSLVTGQKDISTDAKTGREKLYTKIDTVKDDIKNVDKRVVAVETTLGIKESA